MSSLTLALASVFLVCPKEHHIDCSGWNGAAQAEFDVRITAMDGTVCEASIVLEEGSSPEHVRDTLRVVTANDHGYRVREVGKNVLVLEGAKKSAIRSVEFKSKDWKPAVRVELVARPKRSSSLMVPPLSCDAAPPSSLQTHNSEF